MVWWWWELRVQVNASVDVSSTLWADKLRKFPVVMFFQRLLQLQLELDEERDIGELGVDNESLRSLSTELRFSGDGERRLIIGDVHDDIVWELGLGSGEVWRFW
ncbi:hypothetical protein RRF57_007848 [Xylaria bambusicola]|uniref:Uncharacterized protein n=1 Tax=Xylaria bambusicola TaxID=326684 RepID=A0AAN7V120_9PEZI